MRVLGITGYKKSGKTTLLLSLAEELKKRGYRVAAIKHISEHLELAKGDTEKYKKNISQFVGVTDREVVINLDNKKSLEEVLNFFNADIILIEGFKQEKTFPKIVCLREDKEREELFDGLQLCTASLSPLKTKDELVNFNILDREDLKKMVDLIWERSFKLPNLNCGSCGYPNCYELAKEIVQGRKSVQNCEPLKTQTMLKVNGKVIYLNPFVGKLMTNTVKGFLSSLKGYTEEIIETVEIKIEQRK